MSKSKVIAIYKISCIINDKIYIGSSRNVYKRWHNHRFELNSNKHHSQYLQNAWNKYGSENFIFEIIEINDGYSLIAREQFWMDAYMSYNFKYGFNRNPTAEGNHIRKWTPKQRIKYSNSRKNKIYPKVLEMLNKYRKIGSKSNLSSIDEEKVLLIVEALNNGLNYKEISSLYDVTHSTIKHIYRGRTWKHVTKTLHIKEINKIINYGKKAKLNEEQVKEIKLKLINGENHLDIAKQYGVSRTTILDIKKNKTWKGIK